MNRFHMSSGRVAALSTLAVVLAAGLPLAAGALTVRTADTRMMDAMAQRTSQFKGAKANKGFVTHTTKDGKSVLILSDDFVIPDTPAPHWQVVDSKGNVYLLQRLKIKDDKVNKTIVVPAYVPDVAKVQIWCAYAEVLLGEASFESPVK